MQTSALTSLLYGKSLPVCFADRVYNVTAGHRMIPGREKLVCSLFRVICSLLLQRTSPRSVADVEPVMRTRTVWPGRCAPQSKTTTLFCSVRP